MAAGKHFAEPLHTRQHQRGTVLAAALIAAQVQMLTDIFTLRVQALQLVDKLGGVHKAKIHPLPGQRMNSVGGIANQRQTMGGELTRVASGQRENLPFAFKLAKAKAIIKSDVQRLVNAAASACCIRCASSGDSDQTIEHRCGSLSGRKARMPSPWNA